MTDGQKKRKRGDKKEKTWEGLLLLGVAEGMFFESLRLQHDLRLERPQLQALVQQQPPAPSLSGLKLNTSVSGLNLLVYQALRY